MLTEAFRQWIYPRELRIARPRLEPSIALSQLVGVVRSTGSTPARECKEKKRGSDLDARTLAQIGTHLWRLKTKLIDPASAAPRPEFSRAYRHLDAAWDVLVDAGIEIIDPAGRPFDAGQALKAVAFEPVPGMQHDTVIQTIKPSIAIRGQLIQVGEVIVGTPGDASER